MLEWKNTVIREEATVADAIQTIDSSNLHIALVVDKDFKLLGIVTDRDVRRGLLNRITLQESVLKICNRNPTVADSGFSHEKIKSLLIKTGFRHIPITNSERTLVGLEIMAEVPHSLKHDNFIVLMAGGIGERLRPLTNDIPKPMLKVGNQPILQTILEKFISQGFYNFFISVNYKAEIIEDYFGDGSKWGVNIRYLKENKRLGTAGALNLLNEETRKPIIVMNGDLLTKTNFNSLLEFHNEHKASATMCVREYDFQVPYGVVNLGNEMEILKIDEKPIQRFFVNAGIYVIEPENLTLIPDNEILDMPNFFEELMNLKKLVIAFPIREYWLDIGRIEDYRRANGDFFEEFT